MTTTTAAIPFRSSAFDLAIDPVSGGLLALRRPGDPHDMNWLLSPDEQTWLPFGKLWGLGFMGIDPGHSYGRSRWERADELEVGASAMRAVYRLAKGFTVTVERRLVGEALEESYTFASTGFGRDHTIGGLGSCEWGLYLPFNDNYPDSETCTTRRCNAHLWCGGASSWVRAQRMGGPGPHLGLVLTEGGWAGYSVQERDLNVGSNVRGVFLVHPDRVTVPAGGSTRIAWRLFWHEGWDDFWRQAQQVPGFVRLSASQLSITNGENLVVRAEGAAADAAWDLDGTLIAGSPGAVTVPLLRDGQAVLRLHSGGREHRVHAWGRPAMDALAGARVDFLRRRQVIREPGDSFHGHFACYDNAMEARFTDRRYGGELIGMGILAALWQQRAPEPGLLADLHAYHAFLERRWLVGDEVKNVPQDEGLPHVRLYNYAWMAHWLCEYGLVTGEVAPLLRSLAVLEAFHHRDGAHFYAIGLPYLLLGRTLRTRGLDAAAARVLALAEAHAAAVERIGLKYPAHEVNFEQTIVGPAVEICLNASLLGGDLRWRREAERHLDLLERFNGQQPDHRLNDIAIRHWDGYWGGRNLMWGDTFPHYWSGLTGWLLWLHHQAGGPASGAVRARRILEGNASLFTRDGRGSAAHVYPATVDGRQAGANDPVATDQDWVLVWWLMLDRAGCP